MSIAEKFLLPDDVYSKWYKANCDTCIKMEPVRSFLDLGVKGGCNVFENIAHARYYYQALPEEEKEKCKNNSAPNNCKIKMRLHKQPHQ